MGRPIKKGSTDISTVIRIIDSTDGTPETSVAHDTSGIDLWYRREGGAVVSITEASLASADAAHSDGGIEPLGHGYYRLDLPDAAVATASNGVMVGGTVTGMIVIGNYHPLVDYDPQDGVRMGMTALPNAAADAAGGLPISDAGGLDLDAKVGALTFTVAGDVDVNVQTWKGSAAADMTGDAFARLGAPAGASVSADVAAVKSETAAIVADTNELQGDWANGGRLDLIVDAILVDTGTTLDGKIDTIDGIVDAILVDTGTTLDGKIDTIDGIVDNILTDTGTTLEGHLTDIKGATFSGETDSLEALRNRGDAAWVTATGFSTHSAADVWDATSAVLSTSFEVLLDRLYQMISNKMTVNESTGAVALRNVADNGDIATGSVTSSSGTTTRAGLSWV